jgi:DNA-binding transcriptional MerR regulator
MKQPSKVLMHQWEVCEWLGVSAQQLRKWEAAGLIRVRRDGPRSHRLYYTQSLLSLVQTDVNQSKS